MRLIDIIPLADTVNQLAPEELANAMLHHLTTQASDLHSNINVSVLHIRNYCQDESSHYTSSDQPTCMHALATAWEYLIVTGMLAYDPSRDIGWYRLTPRALSLKTKQDYENFRRTALYPRGCIHPRIEEETYAEFLRGDYATAIFKAFKTIEVEVRSVAQADAHVVGRDLMAKAFNKDGVLRDPNEIPAEADSLMELFRGAFGRFRNSAGHREINMSDPNEAIEILQLASLLLRMVDKRTEVIFGAGATSLNNLRKS